MIDLLKLSKIKDKAVETEKNIRLNITCQLQKYEDVDKILYQFPKPIPVMTCFSWMNFKRMNCSPESRGIVLNYDDLRKACTHYDLDRLEEQYLVIEKWLEEQ